MLFGESFISLPFKSKYYSTAPITGSWVTGVFGFGFHISMRPTPVSMLLTFSSVYIGWLISLGFIDAIFYKHSRSSFSFRSLAFWSSLSFFSLASWSSWYFFHRSYLFYSSLYSACNIFFPWSFGNHWRSYFLCFFTVRRAANLLVINFVLIYRLTLFTIFISKVNA